MGELRNGSEKEQRGGGSDGPSSLRPAPQAVCLTLPWGSTIRGVRWRSGDTPVLLLHEPGADLDAWGTLTPSLAARLPLDVVAWDLPGHGLSDDPWEPRRLAELVRVLAGDASAPGPRFLIAAGSIACAVLAEAECLALSGVVLLSPDDGLQPRFPRSPSVSKLVFAGAHAADDLATARRLVNASGGRTIVTSVPVAARGTGLLAGAWEPNIADQIGVFLRDGLVRRHRPQTAF
jgi:pimeloyl-ACP methyl ester carboxylesterase